MSASSASAACPSPFSRPPTCCRAWSLFASHRCCPLFPRQASVFPHRRFPLPLPRQSSFFAVLHPHQHVRRLPPLFSPSARKCCRCCPSSATPASAKRICRRSQRSSCQPRCICSPVGRSAAPCRSSPWGPCPPPSSPSSGILSVYPVRPRSAPCRLYTPTCRHAVRPPLLG